MIGRVADPSNNDIRLKFPCGTTKWYQFNDVIKVDNYVDNSANETVKQKNINQNVERYFNV
jgi:hypothetical protein